MKHLLIASAACWLNLHASAAFPKPLVWDTPSKGSAGSMPIGNGDIGLNVWAEEDGKVRCYIAKTDAWDNSGRLLRLGGVDITLTPNPFGVGDFKQTLDAASGQIVFAGKDGFKMRLWVDANSPTIRFETKAPAGIAVSVRPNIWRREKRAIPPKDLMGYSWYMGGADSMSGVYTAPDGVYSIPDIVADLPGDRIGWYQRNETSFWKFGFSHQQMDGPPRGEKDPLLHRTFGLAMSSPQLAKKGPELLESAGPIKTCDLTIVAHTEMVPEGAGWLTKINALLDQSTAADRKTTWEKHQAWWQGFWDRSHIRFMLTGEPLGVVVSPTTNPLTIGSDLTAKNGFVGVIAQARIYNRALTAQEIRELENKTPAGIAADWDFANYNGGPVTDATAGFVATPFGNPEAFNEEGRSGVKLAGKDGFQVPSDRKLDLTTGGTLEVLISAGTQGAGGGRLLDKGQAGTALGSILDTFPGNSLRLITMAGTLEGGPALPVGGWHRVVAAFDSKSRRLYLDGKLIVDDSLGTIPLAERLTETYGLQRYMTACAGRGAFPIRFNGSLFWGERQDVLGDKTIDPDWRMWAADYWWQNTRLPYYPMMASGDFEMMRPLFEMYFNRLPIEIARTKAWFGCEGAFMGETASFWGMMSNGDYGYERPASLKVGELKNGVMRYYWQPGIEITHMMLDYYDHTGDEDFMKERFAPMAEAYMKYYSSRFGRDAKGKLIITPAQSLETWANVVNPTPDVAGIAQNTKRILALPAGLVPDSLLKLSKEMNAAVPPIPMRTESGKQLIPFSLIK